MGDIETKLGQSLDDLIKKTSVPRAPRRKKRGKKSQKETKKVSGKSLGARKEGSVAGKGKRQQAAGKAKAILSTKQLGSRGVKKRAGTVPVKAKSRDYVVKVRQYDRNGNGGGIGYGLGPKAGVVRRQNPRPKVVKDGTRETLNSRFEKIENPGRRDIRDGKPRAPTYSQRNNYGVILPL